jgi:magnesium transporter
LIEADLRATALPPGIVWIDLQNPTAEETAFVERATGLRAPSAAELSEIESSSRLKVENDAFYFSMAAVLRKNGEPTTTPLGFVVAAERLITIRFEDLPAFASFGQDIKTEGGVHPSSAGAFVGLLEAMVDRMADALEQAGGELDEVSRRVFSADETQGAKARPAHDENALRETLRRIGRAGDVVSKIRDSLMGVGRIVAFASGRNLDWMPAEVKPELETLRLDVLSLNDYDAYLTTKVQFLLDATLGLINIEQNNIIKVLTVVSVVGVPPTLVASWYGMNFKHIPELDWSFGYPYAIVLAIVSAILPLIWLRLKGWF